MAKFILTEEEEVMYFNELDRIKEIIPDLEIQVLSQPLPYESKHFENVSGIGEEFHAFIAERSAGKAVATAVI